MENIDNIMQLCRLCLVKDQVNVPIFGGTNDLEGISSKISSCLPVKVAPDDSLPKKICDDCSYKLDLLYVFRNTSISSEKQLYQWLEQAGISKTTSGTISTAQSLTAPISTDPPFPSVPISTLDTVMNDTITKSEISVKQEKADSTAGSELSAEAQEYLLQQQKLPYQENFGDFNTTGTNSAAADTEEPVRKKPRRAAASKSPIKDNDSDTDMPPTKAEDDSDEDIDDPGDGGMDDDDDDDEEEEDDGLDNPEFVDVPSTSAEEQPGPSGVNKDPIAAPDDPARKMKFFCPICNRGCRSKSALLTHQIVHYDSKPFQCDTCLKNFKTYETYIIHRRRHLQDYKEFCKICNTGFVSKSDYNKHVQAKHEKTSNICTICNKRFSSKYYLDYHNKLHEENYYKERNFICEICSKTFLRKKHLDRHIKLSHTDDGRKYVCDVCGKEMPTMTKLTYHKNYHQGIKPNECNLCGKKFNRKDTLVQHMRTHSGEKPYTCQFCGKSFTQGGPLKIHIRQHTGEKPYSCNICEESFISKSVLTVHLKNKHQKV